MGGRIALTALDQPHNMHMSSILRQRLEGKDVTSNPKFTRALANCCIICFNFTLSLSLPSSQTLTLNLNPIEGRISAVSGRARLSAFLAACAGQTEDTCEVGKSFGLPPIFIMIITILTLTT